VINEAGFWEIPLIQWGFTLVPHENSEYPMKETATRK